MSMFRAAFAAGLVVLGTVVPLRAAEPLRLEDAFGRVIDTHPDLAVLRHAAFALEAEAARAAQRPPLTVEAGIENALGTGDAAGVRGAELTVSLASVLERGDKRTARIAVALERADAIELLRDAKRLDLLAEAARRYLDAAAAQAMQSAASDDVAQRMQIVDAAARRVAAGGAPESVQLAAEAALARADGDLARAGRAQTIAMRRLALLWDGDVADGDRVAAALATVPVVPELDALLRDLQRTPELRTFAHEGRLREARLQLARASRTADLAWDVGVRRLQADDDWALLGSISMPFGSAQRAAPDIRIAEAELAALDLERDGAERALEATLVEAWGRLDAAVAEATRIEQVLLPQLLRAEHAAARAFRAGALGYLEWAQLRSETVVARREWLDANVAAHRALIELQRLTGASLQASGESIR